MTPDKIFNRLWTSYTAQNPLARQIYNLFIAEGEEVINDHIAIRTFNDVRTNIDVIAKPFIDIGYVKKGEYTFPEKHLNARHYELPGNKNIPRVFISQLETNAFSPFLIETVNEIIDQIPGSLLLSDELIFSGLQWAPVSFKIYEKLSTESEYAAWLYVHGFRANHFTISINHLKKYDTIEKVNQFVKENKINLNDAGGEIKGSPLELLEQSSTVSELVKVHFLEGVSEVPACYYEFARRYPDQNGELFSGFIAKSADKIFESTNYY
ncbi:MAG: DUF1338 domain-containing protein [Bacteroidota bacterium]|nr:DUF1338 domain-containing protein [Bacteroidota bacterium]